MRWATGWNPPGLVPVVACSTAGAQPFGYRLDSIGARRSSVGEAEVAHRTADFGPDHADTLAARESLIPTHPDARGLPAALIQARNLTEDMSRVLGPHHPDTLRVRRTLSYCLMDNGKTAEAIQVLTDLLAEVETLTPSRHDELRSVWFRLAVVLERHGDLEKALVTWRRNSTPSGAPRIPSTKKSRGTT